MNNLIAHIKNIYLIVNATVVASIPTRTRSISLTRNVFKGRKCLNILQMKKNKSGITYALRILPSSGQQASQGAQEPWQGLCEGRPSVSQQRLQQARVHCAPQPRQTRLLTPLPVVRSFLMTQDLACIFLLITIETCFLIKKFFISLIFLEHF